MDFASAGRKVDNAPVFWSADTIHGTERVNAGDRDACVFYIPAVPLTENNAVCPRLHHGGTDCRSNTSPSSVMLFSMVFRHLTSPAERVSLSSRIELDLPTSPRKSAKEQWA